MATVGLVLLLLTRRLPQLVLTTSISILQVLTRRPTTIVGSVSPSAVWYTNYEKRPILSLTVIRVLSYTLIRNLSESL